MKGGPGGGGEGRNASHLILKISNQLHLGVIWSRLIHRPGFEAVAFLGTLTQRFQAGPLVASSGSDLSHFILSFCLLLILEEMLSFFSQNFLLHCLVSQRCCCWFWWAVGCIYLPAFTNCPPRNVAADTIFSEHQGTRKVPEIVATL